MKANYRIKPYAHDRLKWIVRGKENGTWTRKFFEKKTEAETFAQIKNTELANQGMEGVSFPAALRVMALECEKRLAEFGKTLRDATDFFIPHLQRSQMTVALRNVAEEVLSAKAAKGIKATTLKVYGHRVKQFAGDVWKYGTTKNPATRYSQSFLNDWGLRYEPQFQGTLPQALSSEKSSILNYLNQNGVLPPGNKIIK